MLTTGIHSDMWGNRSRDRSDGINTLKAELTTGLILLVKHNQGTRVQFPILERSEFCRVVV